MKPCAHPIDQQLPLSMLFLALAEARHQETQRVAVLHKREEPRMRCTRYQERVYEDPERWDGLW